MCGISGFFLKKKNIPIKIINRTLSLMANRGPDNQKFLIRKVKDKSLGFLHSRLSIIDLKDRSNQPMIFGDYSIIFNGELYNYIELRKILKEKGHKFLTNSDTEVLVRCYAQFGEECVNYFVGMWSFAIWDNRKKKLFLSRDIFGEKPLYVHSNSNGIYFGSEIKFINSLLENHLIINQSMIARNLLYGFKSIHKKNQTYFKKVYSVNPGQNLIIDLDFNIKKETYWKPKISINKKMTYETAVENCFDKIKKSLTYRLRSDVPVAFCLSGGIDSSFLASIAKKELNKSITTFSVIDDDDRYNEYENIKIINKDLNSKNHLLHLKKHKKNFFKNLKEVNNYHDSPISTISYYIHYLLTKKIKSKNFKVSISGVGADEIFTGYYNHFLYFFNSIQKSNSLKENIKDWKKNISANVRNVNFKNPMHFIKNPDYGKFIYEDNSFFFKNKTVRKFREKNFTTDLLRNRMLNELFYEIVPVILKHDDANSMFNSVENRSPYLDKELFEFSMNIPSHFLISGKIQKKILRDSSKGILNDQIRNYNKKIGFNASINSLIDLKNKKNVEFYLNENSQLSEIINLRRLKKFIYNYNKSLPNEISKFIFSIISTKIFLNEL